MIYYSPEHEEMIIVNPYNTIFMVSNQLMNFYHEEQELIKALVKGNFYPIGML